IRPAPPVRAAVFRLATWQKDGDIRDAVVVLPTLLAVADIDTHPDLAQAGPGDRHVADRTEPRGQLLMLVIGHGRHDVHPLPDLVEAVPPRGFSSRPQPFLDSRIRDIGGHRSSLLQSPSSPS